MRSARVGVWKSVWLTLFWALSVAAFGVSLSAPQAADGVAWTRTLPGTGLSLIAAIALGWGYRALVHIPQGLKNARLWVLAVFLSGVATLGESFAQTGTAALITGQPIVAALYFAGRATALYMGMVLLLRALARFWPHPASQYAVKTEPEKTEPEQPLEWLENARKRAYTDAKPQNSAAPARALPVWAPHITEDQPKDSAENTLPAESILIPAQTSDEAMPAFPDQAVTQPRTVPEAAVTPEKEAEAYRRIPKETARGAWAGGIPRITEGGLAQDAAPAARRGWPVWAYALVLAAFWLPYLFAVWPGTVSNDSITQLAQIFGAKALGNGNPLAQTGLLWLAVQAGSMLFGTADAGVALYVCVQSALMAWLLGYTLSRISESGAPRWLVTGSLVFFALCPIFPTFAFCVGKDTLFAMAMLWFSLLCWRVLTARKPKLTATVLLCVSAVACALLRNAGAALVGVTLAAMLLRSLLVRPAQWRSPLLALLSAGAALAVLYAVIIPTFNVQPAAETENWSVPLQQVARAVSGGGISEDDRAVISAVLPVDELQSAYNGELSDPVKALWRADATAEQKSAFFGVWLRLGLREPATYLSALFHNGYGYLLPGYVSTLKPTFLMGMEGHTTLIDGKFDFTVNPTAVSLKKTLQSLFNFPLFRLLCAPGLYGWLMLLALAGTLGCASRRNALAMLPAMLTLLGCLFSAVNGYFRYALPLYFAVPFLLAMLAQALRSGRREKRAKANRTV